MTGPGAESTKDADLTFFAGRLAPPKIDLVSIAQALVVAEHLSFSAAANALGVRQSGVSKRVRLLEEDLGVALFERRPRGVRTTLAGDTFLDHARAIILQLDNAVASARQAGRGERGLLRIGVFTSLAGGFLRELLQEFRRAHPDVHVDVRAGERRVHIADVRRHALDVVIATGNGEVVGCDSAELWQERVHVVLPVDHRLADRAVLHWSDIRDEHFIVMEAPPGPEVHDYVVRRVTDYSNYPAVERRGVDQEMLMSMVGMGFGISLVSEGWIALGIPGVVMRPLVEEADIVPFSAIWSPDNDNPVLRRFISAAHVMAGRARRGTSDWAGVDVSDPQKADEPFAPHDNNNHAERSRRDTR